MSDPNPSPLPDLDKRITRLLSIANTVNQKLDALMFSVSELTRRMEILEERLTSGNVPTESDSEQLRKIQEEIAAAENERAAHRNPANMISVADFASLLK